MTALRFPETAGSRRKLAVSTGGHMHGWLNFPNKDLMTRLEAFSSKSGVVVEGSSTIGIFYPAWFLSAAGRGRHLYPHLPHLCSCAVNSKMEEHSVRASILIFLCYFWSLSLHSGRTQGVSGKLPDKPELGCVCLKWVVNTVFITVYRPLKRKAVLKPCCTLCQMRQRSEGKTTESGGAWAQCLQSHRASFN